MIEKVADITVMVVCQREKVQSHISLKLRSLLVEVSICVKKWTPVMKRSII